MDSGYQHVGIKNGSENARNNGKKRKKKEKKRSETTHSVIKPLDFILYNIYGNPVDINLGSHFMYARKVQFETIFSLTSLSFHWLYKVKGKETCCYGIFLGIMICL